MALLLRAFAPFSRRVCSRHATTIRRVEVFRATPAGCRAMPVTLLLYAVTVVNAAAFVTLRYICATLRCSRRRRAIVASTLYTRYMFAAPPLLCCLSPYCRLPVCAMPRFCYCLRLRCLFMKRRCRHMILRVPHYARCHAAAFMLLIRHTSAVLY